MRELSLYWQYDGWDQGEKTQSPNLYTTKAILPQIFGLIYSFLRIKQSFSVDLERSSFQNNTVHYSTHFHTNPARERELDLWDNMSSNPLVAKMSLRQTGLHYAAENKISEKNSLPQREHCHKFPRGFWHGYHLRFPQGFPRSVFLWPTKCNYLLQQSHLYHMEKRRNTCEAFLHNKTDFLREGLD